MWFRSAANSGGNAGRRSAPSILGDGLRLDGDISCPGEIHVGGTMIGNLTASKLTLGEGGSINGSVEAETAIINGALQGRLVAVNVVLGSAAHVSADVVYCSMRIEPGAVFEGFSRRVERDQLPAVGDAKQLLLKTLRDSSEHADAPGVHATPAEVGG